MKLTHKQKRVAFHIYDVGRRKGASRKDILSAIETALVEANLTNPAGGDRDSVGWRQERGHYGSAGRRMNVRGAAGRFYDELKGAGGGTPGQRAQAVQRSAFPERYDQREGEARQVLAWLDKTNGKASPTKDSMLDSPPATPVTAEPLPSLTSTVLGSGFGSGKPGRLLSLARASAERRSLSEQQTAASAATTITRARPKKVNRSGLQDGGGWAGTKNLAERAGRGLITSRKRTPQQNAAVGGAPESDHLTTKKNAYAVDMKYGTGRTVAKRLGLKGWKPGTYARFTINVGGHRYSVQLLENVEGHYDHTHLGIQRV